MNQYVGGVRTVVKYIFSKPPSEQFESLIQSSGSSLLDTPSPKIETAYSNTPTPSYVSDATITVIVLLFILWQFIFSIGAALQSYMYNKMVGTGDVLTVIYMILCFSFSYIYYPFYTFFLSSSPTSVNRSLSNYSQAAGRRK